MDSELCTICGAPAGFCARCKSAAYCSLECQHTDWEVHRLLCKKYSHKADANFQCRPSPRHRLVIFFPMKPKDPTKRSSSITKPTLRWIDTKVVKRQLAEYFYPDLGKLLSIAQYNGVIRPLLKRVRGNALRGRETNKDTIDIWHLDPDIIKGVVDNESLHGSPSPLGDTWAETVWRGPIIVTMREGNDYDLPLVKDVDLVAYRDALDFLGYYRADQGSVVDDFGKKTVFAQKILQLRAGKMMGWRLNCEADQVDRGELAAVPVSVPRAHPLVLHGDDPLQIPQLLDFQWVITRYPQGSREGGLAPGQLENRLARLLLTRITVKDGKWTRCRDCWKDAAIGSMLLVERYRGEIKQDVLMAICRLIEEKVLPLMTDERALQPGAAEELVEIIIREGENLLAGIQADDMEVDST